MSPHTDTESRAGRAAPFLRALLLGRKNLQLYPAENLAVAESLSTALDQMEAYLGGVDVRVDVRLDGLYIGPEAVPDPDGRFRRFAVELYRRAVGAMHFHPGATLDELRAVLSTLARAVDDLLLTGGPAAQPALANISTITIEHAEGVEIVGSAEDALPLDRLLEEAQEVVSRERLGEPQRLEHFFLRVSEGDPERIRALQVLLSAPERLTLLFQNLALHIHEQTGDEGGLAVTQLLRIIEAAGDIIADFDAETTQHRMYRGLAEAVRGLGEKEREALVVEGLIPNLAAGGVEARILRLFPVPELANAFTRSIIENEGSVEGLVESFGGMQLDADDGEMLGLLIRGQLEGHGMLTPEMDAFFNDVLIGALPAETMSLVSGAEDVFVLLPPGSQIDADSVRWQGREYRKARQEARREALKPLDLNMLPLLRDLIGVERRLADYDALIAQARQLLVNFLEKEQYAQATEILRLLKQQRQERAGEFTPRQLARLERVTASLVDARLTDRLLTALDEAEPDSLEERQLMEYFRELDQPLIRHLLERLDTEKSRHLRLVLCKTIARLTEHRLELLTEHMDGAPWYVVRNIMTIADEIGGDTVVPIARRALSNNDARVVREAHKVLASIHSPEAVTVMLSGLASPDPKIQAVTASWLGIVGDERAIQPLLSILSPDPYAVDVDLAVAVIEALGRFNTSAVRSLLQPLAGGRGLLGRKKRAALSEAATKALAQHRSGQ